jgi:hypothetical protein
LRLIPFSKITPVRVPYNRNQVTPFNVLGFVIQVFVIKLNNLGFSIWSRQFSGGVSIAA